MPFPWAIARFLIKVVAPTVPDIVSTVTTIRKQRAHAQEEAREEEQALERRLTEIERTMVTQMQLVEQLTGQLQALHKTVVIALRLAIAGLILSVVALAVLMIR